MNIQANAFGQYIITTVFCFLIFSFNLFIISFVQIVSVDHCLIISWIFTYINSLLGHRLDFRLHNAAIENIKDFITHNATLMRLRWSPASRLVQIKADVMTQRGHWGHSLVLTLILLTNQSPVMKRDVKAAMFVRYVLLWYERLPALFSFKQHFILNSWV